MKVFEFKTVAILQSPDADGLRHGGFSVTPEAIRCRMPILPDIAIDQLLLLMIQEDTAGEVRYF
jgi:hypothetical protein